MSRKYITLTQDAVQEIFNRGVFSTIEFPYARALLDCFLNKKAPTSSIEQFVALNEINGGLVISSKKENYSSEKNSITIDLEAISFSSVSESQSFVAIQKLLRFCIKHWNKYSLTNNEYIPPGSSKAIIFPFPIATKSSHRLVVEMSPDAKRSERRYQGENFLLYKFSTSEGDGLREEASSANYRKAMASVFSHDLYKNKAEGQSAVSAALPVLKLDNQNEVLYRGKFNSQNWREGLTSKQSDFVFSDCLSPSRIEGPAGSGKTLCMVLKCINAARNADAQSSPFSALFITPSSAMVRNVQSLFDQYCNEGFHRGQSESVVIRVATLHQICVGFLGGEIKESELLDDDPQDSKDSQLLHLAEILESEAAEFSKNKTFLSPELFEFLYNEDSISSAELLRHEISTVIKGRAGEELDEYLKSQRPSYGLPIKSLNDRKYIFSLFRKYCEILDNLGQYDVDDVVVSVSGRLATPLWRRRRRVEGYDALFVDELHLFNFNEFSIFHFLSKGENEAPITVAADPAQALGDIAWNPIEVSEALCSSQVSPIALNAVFRCSPEITDLAFSVAAHGQTLFTNFDNPLDIGSTVDDAQFVDRDFPEYHLIDAASDIFDYSYKVAKSLTDKGVKRSDVLFVLFDRPMYEGFLQYSKTYNKPSLALSKRGDIDLVVDADKRNSFVFGLADHVGGLEFKAVILVGVDAGRVPSLAQVTGVASKLYQSYLAHNRVYVSVTRAQTFVRIIGERARGVSEVFSGAKDSNLYKEVICG